MNISVPTAACGSSCTWCWGCWIIGALPQTHPGWGLAIPTLKETSISVRTFVYALGPSSSPWPVHVNPQPWPSPPSTPSDSAETLTSRVPQRHHKPAQQCDGCSHGNVCSSQSATAPSRVREGQPSPPLISGFRFHQLLSLPGPEEGNLSGTEEYYRHEWEQPSIMATMGRV